MLAFMGCSHANAAPTKKQTTDISFSQMTMTATVILADENMEVLQTFKVSEAIHVFKPIVCLELENPLLFMEDKYVVSHITDTNLYTANFNHKLYTRTDHNQTQLNLNKFTKNSIKIRADSRKCAKS